MDLIEFIQAFQQREIEILGDCLDQDEIIRLLENANIELPKKKIKFKNKRKSIMPPRKSICQKFVDKCKKKNIKVYEYKSSIFWTGPAIVIGGNIGNDSSKLLVSMLKTFKDIPLNLDQENDKYIIYPQCKAPSEKDNIIYDFTYSDEIKEINVSFWNYGKQIYIVDSETNEVFDSSTHEKLGTRILDSNGEMTIDYND